ncbi:hypothetical protein JCM10908_004426 [Rhodotorula pacifica]|uniref:uncharacterized protein n=1 Tax=Rhodotorula pacifica TaxID=1495444 RepID=UPI00317C419D
MNSSRPLLRAATAKHAPPIPTPSPTTAAPTPRRRVRTLPPSSSATLPPARDLIGPPCPLSNLRPVYYAPLFPSLHSPSGWGDLAAAVEEGSADTASRRTGEAAAAPPRRKQHPYSLAEFPTLSPSSLPSSQTSSAQAPRPERLESLRRRLHAQDLEWRWARYRFDAFNQGFWTRMNERFLRGRDAYLARLDSDSEADPVAVRTERDLGRETFPPRTSAAYPSSSSESASAREVDLSPFYAQHLADTKRAYADYNKQLWRLQAGLIGPAVRASLRNWRWKWEVWRAGVGRSGGYGGL